jgi:hypothetical protein
MSKPAKTEAELIAMARAELKVHADCSDGIVISVLRAGDSREFRTVADAATVAKPGYPECVAPIVQIADHLCKQFDVSRLRVASNAFAIALLWNLISLST